ncbi:MAG: hypothetical protein Q8N88_00990 [Nanoarchaeota archaeon]|nr:hypothetical protein [Nanoarchaeota archaeon]
MNKTNKNQIGAIDIIGYFAIVLIVVSLFFIGMKITGYAATTDTAVVNVTVSTSGAINFTVDFINFGTGSVDSGKAGALLNTENSVTNGSWTPISTPLVLENIGNVNVTLALASSKNASSFIGGLAPTFKVKVADKSGEAGSCVTPGASSYTELTTANLTVCSPLQFNNSLDEVDIDIQLYIPSDSSSGGLTTTITATGTY